MMGMFLFIWYSLTALTFSVCSLSYFLGMKDIMLEHNEFIYRVFNISSYVAQFFGLGMMIIPFFVFIK